MLGTVPEFVPFGKIARWNREIVITEKLDGTNGVIHVPENPEENLIAGSRNRWLLPNREGGNFDKQNTNYGFESWVQAYSSQLRGLGPGTHFGEWWGVGIQRGYGLFERRFSLFNVSKWSDPAVRPACCDVVPVLYVGLPSHDFHDTIWQTQRDLTIRGSSAAPGYMDPEGIVIFHKASNNLFKITLKNDEASKGR